MSLNIKLIRDSFSQAVPVVDKVVVRFYENLWTDYPQSKNFFENTDMENQRRALLRSLVFIVNNLEDEEKLVSYLKGMGGRHVKYGVGLEQAIAYEWVGASLLKTLGEFLGEDWTPQVKNAWISAFGIISQVMQEGAKESIAKTASKLALVKNGTKNISEIIEAIHTQVKESVRDYVTHVVQQSLEEILKTEIENIEKRGIKDYLKQAA